RAAGTEDRRPMIAWTELGLARRRPSREGSACAAGILLLAVSLLAAPAAADDGAPAQRPETYPLSLLLQVDALLASKPDATADPQDAPAGAALRWRRLRVGDDLAFGDFRLRALFEAEGETSTGSSFTPLAGGRLPFGGALRATEVYAAWAPTRAFQIAAGSLRIPFSLSRQSDEADLRLPERPAFVDAFLPDFRTGASLGGDLGELTYRAAVMSADPVIDGQLFDHGLLVAGRLVAEPLGPVGATPWRRPASDPWTDWFRFAAGLSALYGTLAAPNTFAIDPDFTAQWRAFVVTTEYLYLVRYAEGVKIVPGSIQQGAAIEPGATLFERHLDLVARADWERAGSTNVWGAGAGLTAYGPDPRLRFHAGFERRWSAPTAAGTDGGSYWVILRVAIVVN
ncbi:MAG TPA: hypothetical protein VI456_08805, partial [Polyangia bacterium]